MTKHIFRTHGLDDPEAWDCDATEYLGCIESYDGSEANRIELEEDGYYNIYFPDGHYILGVAGFHLEPNPQILTAVL